MNMAVLVKSSSVAAGVRVPVLSHRSACIPTWAGPSSPAVGLYDPWLQYGAIYVPLPDDDDVLAIGRSRAVTLVDARRQ